MKPIGGYFELERGTFTPRHQGVYVNSGCNALRLAYADFRKNDDALFNQPLRTMSNLTRALMSTIDENSIRTRRLANFSYLFNRLKTDFTINPLPESAPLVYPFLPDPQKISDAATLRERLIAAKIFCPTYWPDITKMGTAAKSLVENLVCIPFDQRYGEDDMDRILEVING